MATIGVLTYTLPHGLKLKTHTNRIANINNNNNKIINNNNINTRLEQVGMIGGEILVMRRKQKIVPLTESSISNVQSGPAAKRPRLSEPINTNNQISVTSGIVGIKKISTPQPQAVARRNARERNRVKQVNNGFAALREHIPEEVAEAFEAAGNGRGTSKKLSKVETLRMAVEYIRSLERLLGIDTNDRPSSVDDVDFGISQESTMMDSTATPTTAIPPTGTPKTVIKTESCVSPIDDQYSESNYDPDENTIYFNETLPDITTVNGQQYVRIPGTNTYQLITTEMFENEENIQPIPVTNYNNIHLEQQLEYITATSAIPTTMTTVPSSDEIVPVIAPAPISPNDQSNSCFISTSPAEYLPHQHQQQQHQQILSQMQLLQSTVNIKNEQLTAPTQLYNCHMAPNSSPTLSDSHNFIDAPQMYDGVVTLKQKIKEECVILETTGMSEDSMMDAIDWWDTHRSDESVVS